MMQHVEMAPPELDSLVLFFSSIVVDTQKATVLAALAFYKERFLVDTIPKEWLAQDVTFCEQFVLLSPENAHLAICLRPATAWEKKSFLKKVQLDYKYASRAHIDLVRDAALMAKAAVMVDPRIMGWINHETHTDPKLLAQVNTWFEKLSKVATPSEVDERSEQVSMLLAKGNGWKHRLKPRPEKEKNNPFYVDSIDSKAALDMHKAESMTNFLTRGHANV